MTNEIEATVVIPVKPWALSKSRLDVGTVGRERLARAFSLDVLHAVVASTRLATLVVVTAEPEFATAASRCGAVVLVDRPMLSPDMLNPALASARSWALVRRPEAPVVVVPADLPSLTASVLDAAIDQLSHYESAFVPDAVGQGTTLAWGRSPRDLRLEYGLRSAVKHSAAGARAVSDVDARARWDVDTDTDLAEARRLGVGVHTTAALEELMALASRGRR